MDAAGPGGLRPTGETLFDEEVAGGASDLAAMLKGESIGGIEVDAQLVRAVEILDTRIPRVEVETPNWTCLDHIGGVLDVRHVSRASRRELDGMSVRHRSGSAFRKEEVLGNPAVPTLQRRWPVPHRGPPLRRTSHSESPHPPWSNPAQETAPCRDSKPAPRARPPRCGCRSWGKGNERSPVAGFRLPARVNPTRTGDRQPATTWRERA